MTAVSDLRCRRFPIAMAAQLQVEAATTVRWSAVSWRKRPASEPSHRPPIEAPRDPSPATGEVRRGEGAMFPTASLCGYAVCVHTFLPAGLPACLLACLPACLPAGMLACYPSSCRFVLVVAWKLNGDSHPTPSRVQDRTAKDIGKAINCEIVRDSDRDRERESKEGRNGRV